jgi:pre-mRNA-splicing factor RBM22/SLT11
MSTKSDINKVGWEDVDCPSVCEKCLGPNPYVRMTKEKFGLECKICTRPTTVFRWMPEKESRFSRTKVCMTCARLRNCCQSCLLDLQFGLPIQIRDAALNLVAQGPNSHLNREYYAQNIERKLAAEKERGLITPAEYDKADASAMKLLAKLSKADAYYKRDRPTPCKDYGHNGSCPRGDECTFSHEPEDHPHLFFSTGEPTKRSRLDIDGGLAAPVVTKGEIIKIPVGPIDLTPPKDANIMSLFLTGVEDDLPEYAIKEFFAPYGTIRSVVCVHKARSAFVNFTTRAGAEKAVKEACGTGDIVIQSNPLRVQWGKPRPLGPIAEEQAQEIRQVKKKRQQIQSKQNRDERRKNPAMVAVGEGASRNVNLRAAPPGADGGTKYRSQWADYQD